MGTPSELQVFEDHESQVRGYCRRFDTLFTRAQGSVLVDNNGRRYIDFLACAGSLNYGHNDPDMIEALIAHMRNLGFSAGLDLHTESKRRFLQAFTSGILEPRGLNHRVQFTGPTGANAIEAAFKLARKVTGRRNIISFTNGYHGVSMGALAATGNRFNRMGASLPDVTRVAYDGYYGSQVDTADQLAQLLDDPSSGVDLPAAIVLEVVQGEGGLNVASAPWLRKIAALARKHGALLIVDDIQAGCGRTGKFFSFEGTGVKPDLIALSKSISGFGLPMSLLLVSPDADQWKPGEHNGTFRGNNHAFVTATVAIEKFWVDAPAFEGEISQRAERVHDVLLELAQRVPQARVKGRGMFQGLDVRDGALSDRILRNCFVNGLVIEAAGPHDEVIKVMAPVNTPLPLLDQGLDILRHAVMEVMGTQPAQPETWPARLVTASAAAEPWSQQLI